MMTYQGTADPAILFNDNLAWYEAMRDKTPAADFDVASGTRPLCPYPEAATHGGHGDINDAASFHCE